MRLFETLYAVSKNKKIHIPLLMAKSRKEKRVSDARQIVFYLFHTSHSLSFTEISHIFKRDRTTISYAMSIIEDKRDNKIFDKEISRIEGKIISPDKDIQQFTQELNEYLLTSIKSVAPRFLRDFYVCEDCGRARSYGSGKRCLSCYKGVCSPSMQVLK